VIQWIPKDGEFIYPCYAFKQLLLAVKNNDSHEINILCWNHQLLNYLEYRGISIQDLLEFI